MTNTRKSLRVLEEVMRSEHGIKMQLHSFEPWSEGLEIKSMAKALHHLLEFLEGVPEAEHVVNNAQRILLKELSA